MKITTLLAKHYDVFIGDESDDLITYIEIFEKGEHSENIGTLLQHSDKSGNLFYQWRGVSGPVADGTAYTDADLRKAIRARAFG